MASTKNKKRMRRTRFNGSPSCQDSRTALSPALQEVAHMKEQMFAHEYLADLDPVGAGLRSGMVSMQLDYKTQETLAAKIFHRPAVQTLIKAALKDKLLCNGVTEDKVVRELANIAFFDIGDLTDETGDFKPIHSLPREVRSVIQEMEYKVLYRRENGQQIPQGHITKVKLHDKLNSLKQLLSRLSGKDGDRPHINYNQFNINSQTINNTVNINRPLDMSEFSDAELAVIRKMAGNQDPMDLIPLQQIEAQYYESESA